MRPTEPVLPSPGIRREAGRQGGRGNLVASRAWKGGPRRGAILVSGFALPSPIRDLDGPNERALMSPLTILPNAEAMPRPYPPAGLVLPAATDPAERPTRLVDAFGRQLTYLR